MEKHQLINLMRNAIDACELVYTEACKSGMKNSQELLDWLDRINEISVR